MEAKIRTTIKDARDPSEAELDAVGDLLEEQDGKGIWILAPQTLGLDQDSIVTILGWDYYKMKDRGRKYISSSGVVVATRVDSRDTVASLITEPKEPFGNARSPAASTAEPPDDDDENLLTFQFSLLERLPELPWRPGTYLIDVMLEGQESNRLQFQLTPGKAAERDPAIAQFIEQSKAPEGDPPTLLPPPDENAPYPNYRKTNATPPLPEEPGIQLAVDRVVVYKPGARSILRGSFRLPVPAAYYSKPAGKNNSDQVPVSAIVPITLVLTGNDMVGPFVAPLRVATYDPVQSEAAETVVTGQFAIDLFALPTTSKVVQTYTLWAYSGAHRSAPVLTAVITPDMLK